MCTRKIYVLEQKLENNVYPCKPQFYYIKAGCKGSTLHGHVIMMCLILFLADFVLCLVDAVPEIRWSKSLVKEYNPCPFTEAHCFCKYVMLQCTC